MLLLDAPTSTPLALTLLAGWVAFVTPRLWATDVAEHRLPNRLVMPGWLVAVAAIIVASFEAASVAAGAVWLAVAVLVVAIAFGLVGVIGMGDAKLAVPLSVGLGLHGDGRLLLGAVVAVVVAGTIAVAHLVRRRDPSARIALGPALLLGFWFAYVA